MRRASLETTAAAVLMVGGLATTLLTGMWVSHMSRLAEDGGRAPVTEVRETYDGPISYYVVGDHTYRCEGRYQVGQIMAYDREHPAICRAEDHQIWGTLTERFGMLGGVILALAGAALLVYERWFHRDSDVLDELAALERALEERDRG